MSDFVKKASSKIDKLSDEQIKRVINGLEKKLELRNDVLDTVDVGYAILKNDLTILYANKYLAALLQFDYEALIPGKTSLSEIIIDSNIVSGIENTVKSNKTSYDESFSHIHSILGEIKIHVRLLKNKNQYVLVLRDISLLEKFRVDFQRNESLASMTTMAAGIAHEIKNPLASMSIYLQLLRKKLDKDGSIKKEEAEKSLNIISDEIERLNAMAVDFLFAVKPMNVDLHIKNINSIVEKTLDLIKAEIDENHIKLVSDLGISIPNVSVDENLFEQCLLNLVRNAIQAIDPKSRDGFIEIKTSVDGNYVLLSVEDNGCGMNDTELTRIFEPYYTTKANGTGLGLTTIFKIIREHAGEINVSSHKGSGSTFTIKLPVPPSERFRIEEGN